jgi:hypothetical protein
MGFRAATALANREICYMTAVTMEDSPLARGMLMEERRALPRQKSFLKGTIYFNNRRSTLDCMIRDITAHGARLQTATTATIPEAIELYIPNKDQTLRAQVKWRKGDEMGVMFLGVEQAADQPAAPPSGLAQRVERLEAEIAKLHRIVLELKQEYRNRFGE